MRRIDPPERYRHRRRAHNPHRNFLQRKHSIGNGHHLPQPIWRRVRNGEIGVQRVIQRDRRTEFLLPERGAGTLYMAPRFGVCL